MGKSWAVYIIETECGRYYTGITVDLERRFKEHKTGKGGAKYFRSFRPKEVVYSESCSSRSAAAKREAAIKKLTHQKKKEMVVLQKPYVKS